MRSRAFIVFGIRHRVAAPKVHPSLFPRCRTCPIVWAHTRPAATQFRHTSAWIYKCADTQMRSYIHNHVVGAHTQRQPQVPGSQTFEEHTPERVSEHARTQTRKCTHAETPRSIHARAKKEKRKNQNQNKRIPMGTLDSSNRGVIWRTFGFLFRFLVERAPHVRFRSVMGVHA